MRMHTIPVTLPLLFALLGCNAVIGNNEELSLFEAVDSGYRDAANVTDGTVVRFDGGAPPAPGADASFPQDARIPGPPSDGSPADSAATGDAVSQGDSGGAGGDGAADTGTPTGGCFINGSFEPKGASSPVNPCARCDPATNAIAWTTAPDGTDCGNGQVCNRGNCAECAPQQTHPVACGNCGTDTEVCSSLGTWESSGTCAGEGICSLGSKTTCNSYGTQTCVGHCAWASCSCPVAAVCTPGDTCRSGCSVLSCDSCGQWPGACGGTCPVPFGYTGAAQTFVVPSGVLEVKVSASGAAGGEDCYGTDGGLGGSVEATLPVVPGETLVVNVGGVGGRPFGSGGCHFAGVGGWNGGADGGDQPNIITNPYAGAGGGGATDVRQGGATLDNRVIVAGGGGGAGGGSGGGPGGSGGGLIGGAGGIALSSAGGGGGGTTVAGGVGGGPGPGGYAGSAGTLAAGGKGGTAAGYDSGGGGGGGLFGGGGGGGTGTMPTAGGGGGGSSYTIPTATNVNVLQGVQGGNGQVVITY